MAEKPLTRKLIWKYRKPEMVPLTIRLPVDVHAAFERQCCREARSMNSAIFLFVCQYLAGKIEAKYPETPPKP